MLELILFFYIEEVLLENVELILEAFDYLQLPFALKQGTATSSLNKHATKFFYLQWYCYISFWFFSWWIRSLIDAWLVAVMCIGASIYSLLIKNWNFFPRSSWEVKHQNSMEKAWLGSDYYSFRGCLHFCIPTRWSRGTSQIWLYYSVSNLLSSGFFFFVFPYVLFFIQGGYFIHLSCKLLFC